MGNIAGIIIIARDGRVVFTYQEMKGSHILEMEIDTALRCV